ncbi:hypothetical protein B5K06_22910 [Rhizobium grahamii]|uniref:Uncharacterized protein n=1 Tax=Rhizobium grahamii TaxID=1120045 RepID=A0A370KJF8_9HYPH|nr:hypothetical protein B5K06_22910 [Rhizobium grahamii]
MPPSLLLCVAGIIQIGLSLAQRDVKCRNCSSDGFLILIRSPKLPCPTNQGCGKLIYGAVLEVVPVHESYQNEHNQKISCMPRERQPSFDMDD